MLNAAERCGKMRTEKRLGFGSIEALHDRRGSQEVAGMKACLQRMGEETGESK